MERIKGVCDNFHERNCKNEEKKKERKKVGKGAKEAIEYLKNIWLEDIK